MQNPFIEQVLQQVPYRTCKHKGEDAGVPDKLIRAQEHDVQITPTQVMVPEWFERDWENALFLRARNHMPH